MLQGLYVAHEIHQHSGGEKWQKFLRDLCHDFRGRILPCGNLRECLDLHEKDRKGVELRDNLLTEKGLRAE